MAIMCKGSINNICPNHPEWGTIDNLEEACFHCSFINPNLKRTMKTTCDFMSNTGEQVPDKPCKGNWIICKNSESPIYNQEKAWYSCNCNSTKCKFFTSNFITANVNIPPFVIASKLYKTFEKLCYDNGIILDAKPTLEGFTNRHKSSKNFVMWGVKWSHDKYVENNKNVLFIENGLLGQKTGCYVDSNYNNGGYFAHSSICRSNEYDITMTEQESYQLAKHMNNIGYYSGNYNPKGDILLVLQMEKDAPLNRYFPLSTYKKERKLQFLELCKKHLKGRVRVRMHPNEKTLPSLFKMPQDWIVDEIDSPQESIKQARALVTVNSTLGTEALFTGIKVATLGIGAFTGSGATLECANRAARLENLDKWMPNKPLNYLNAVYKYHHLSYESDLLNNPAINKWIERAKDGS